MEELYLSLLIKRSESIYLAQYVLSIHKTLYLILEITENLNSVPEKH